jgi:hypothetical protein
MLDKHGTGMMCVAHNARKSQMYMLVVMQRTSAGAADECSAVLLVHFYAVPDLQMTAHA